MPYADAMLNALTDVKMFNYAPAAEPSGDRVVAGYSFAEYRCDALVLGSGAAGWRAAVELKRRGVDVTIASSKAFWGTSACSGSDKQTLHTACTRADGDDFLALSDALSAGGAMDRDTAYVEAVGSVNACEVLKYLGLDLPEDALGATLRYQTDHDEFGRATSCGPRTSRLMVKVLAQEAMRLEIPLLDHATAISILTEGEGSERRAVGVIVIDKSRRDNPWQMALIRCRHLVLATGGPGELYRDSVYPKNCFSALGMALEAGIRLVNLTESQFGIGTPRTRFPWNLSGTYMQAMPRIYSQDDAGNQYNFLADYYPTTRQLASATFKKGYQWPFHAERMLNYGSSLLDVAVYEETKKGREVFLDFLSNPSPGADNAAFTLNDLDEETAVYLAKNNALLETPLDRLRQMNPLAVPLYQLHGHDLTSAPLQFAMNNQHLNGGIDVDTWGQTSLTGCYAIGENAGTHGVTRPGGAALNAGQVFAKRCAQHIAHRNGRVALGLIDERSIKRVVALAQRSLEAGEEALSLEEVRRRVQDVMSDSVGILCRAADVDNAVETLTALCQDIERLDVKAQPHNLTRVMQWKQSAKLALAIATSLQFYIQQGGGSRGARAIHSDRLGACPDSAKGPLKNWRFLPEKASDRHRMVCIRQEERGLVAYFRACREQTPLSLSDFEHQWQRWLRAAVFDADR